MQLKVRNGFIFNVEKYSKNDSYISFRMDYLSWGLGFDFCIGDSRRFFRMSLLCFHLDIWF
jgi:hypothetical protein